MRKWKEPESYLLALNAPHVKAILLNKTDCATTVDTTVTVTFAGSVFAFVSEPNVFVSHVRKSKIYTGEVRKLKRLRPSLNAISLYITLVEKLDIDRSL